jgi:alkaline phosphatase D
MSVVYDMHMQGVIPSNPDAWVWLGDITYMDDPLLDCAQVPGFPECNCSADFMRRPPFQ